MYRAHAHLAAHAGVAVRHGDGGLLVAGSVEGDAAVPRHVVHEPEVPAADEPEGLLDSEAVQGLGYRFVYLDLSVPLIFRLRRPVPRRASTLPTASLGRGRTCSGRTRIAGRAGRV